MGLGDTIKEENQEAMQNCAKSWFSFVIEYLTVKITTTHLAKFKEKVWPPENSILPKARYDWMYLQL